VLIEMFLNVRKIMNIIPIYFGSNMAARDFQIHLKVKGIMMLMQTGFMLPRIKSRGGLLWMCH
jgi:hypothetical protein